MEYTADVSGCFAVVNKVDYLFSHSQDGVKTTSISAKAKSIIKPPHKNAYKNFFIINSHIIKDHLGIKAVGEFKNHPYELIPLAF